MVSVARRAILEKQRYKSEGMTRKGKSTVRGFRTFRSKLRQRQSDV